MTAFDRTCNLLFGYPKSLIQRLAERWVGGAAGALIIWVAPSSVFELSRAQLDLAIAVALGVSMIAPIAAGSVLVHWSGMRRPSWERQTLAFADEIAKLGCTRTILIIGALGGTPAVGMIMLAMLSRTSDFDGWPLVPDLPAPMLLAVALVAGLARGHIAWRLAWAFDRARTP